jgi:hypothetical protein
MATITYIAKPQDSRCQWWSLILSPDIQLDGRRIDAPFLRKGADLELNHGDMLVDSEANHHTKNRGYSVTLGIAIEDEANEKGGLVVWVCPGAAVKAYIKTHGGQDLMHETGDVNACVRLAVWLRRQPDLKQAVGAIKAL